MTRASNYFPYWGKADKHVLDGGAPCHLLVYHCLDVAAVGYEYLARSKTFVRLLSTRFPVEDETIFQDWLAFWLALHDLGKFAQVFQQQRPDLVTILQGNKNEFHGIYDVRHDTLGWLLWKKELEEKIAAERWFGEASDWLTRGELLDAWAQAVMGHHGKPPKNLFLLNANCDTHFHSNGMDAAWAFTQALRDLFLSRPEVAGFPEFLDVDTFPKRSQQISWQVAGLTVLADWLGSNRDFFPWRATPMPLREYWDIARQCAREALSKSGVLHHDRREEETFGRLFPGIETLSPLQTWATSVQIPCAPRTGKGKDCPLQAPQFFLLEDVTGAGKTEAALMLAHRLIAAGAANGFFIALPTMATANAMYGRINQVFARLFGDDASLALAHGQRALVEDFAASVLPADACLPDERQADSSASARCTAWLADHNKRALLAAAGVGTLDQALLAVLYSRHQSLRLLGLLGKVLIVDEVHACDAYMQEVLERLLCFHASFGGSVILLSATLTGKMKQSLLDAFACGCEKDPPRLARTNYPLVTAWRGDAALAETALETRADVSRTVQLRYLEAEDDVLRIITAALEAGQCVCWMRNTVKDALSVWKQFRDRLDAEHLILFHSRFALEDRLAIEARILECFGKASTAEKRRGKLVIATQVVEQSLDADWDVVLSDLAPIDRLIQRMGRLRRHRRDKAGNPLSSAAMDQRGAACFYVYGPCWREAPTADWLRARFRGTAAVYAHLGQMWRSARIMRQGCITLPDEARHLIETVFGADETLPESLRENAGKMQGQAYADTSLAQMNTLSLAPGYIRGNFDWWEEARAPSRLGEKSVRVVLACWEAGRLRPWSRKPCREPRHAWDYSTLSMPERLISAAKEPDTSKVWQACRELLETMPGKGEWSVLLVLEQEAAGSWQGWARKPEDQGKTTTKPTRWRYDPAVGLVEAETTDE